jgi:tetraacyldisaccharide 4'-kinase
MYSAKLLFWGQKLIEKGAWYLAPLSWVYAFFVYLRNFLYDYRFFSVTKVRPVVVSIGNVLAGGTGKTPFVHMLAEKFSHRKVAILSRGYGTVPDEAMLLAKKLPHVKVHVGKNRARLAKQIDADLILLDDGFQHRKLNRDFDIVLGGGEGHYLPKGFLRDDPRRLKKADAEFLLGRDLSLTVEKIFDLEGREVPSIENWEVGVFCGIANPERFFQTVKALGAKIVSKKIFADHEQADLSRLDFRYPWICTEKDWIKLPKTSLAIYVLQMKMQVTGNVKVWENLVEKIDKTIDNRKSL